MPAYEQAFGVVRPGGTISRVGVPQYEEAPVGFASLFGGNITLTGGPAPARAYIEQLLPGVLDGTVNPGKVFDRTDRPRRRPGRLPGHGRPRGAQDPRDPLIAQGLRRYRSDILQHGTIAYCQTSVRVLQSAPAHRTEWPPMPEHDSPRHRVVVIGSGLRRTVRHQGAAAQRRRGDVGRQDDAPPLPAVAVPGGDGNLVARRDRTANARGAQWSEERPCPAG